MHKDECDQSGGRGAPRETWSSCVKRDMKAMDMKEGHLVQDLEEYH